MRLIDASVVEAELWNARRRCQMMDDSQTADKIMHGLHMAEQIVKDIPAVDATPLTYGDWRVIEAEDGRALCECGVCKDWVVFYYDYMPNFCPNCGAKRRLTATCKEATE